MKNSLYIILLLTSAALAQVTLDSRKIPISGDRVYIISADESGIDSMQGGSDKLWDFSSLYISDNFTTMKFVHPSETPFADEFPQANLAAYSEELQELAGYMFYYGTASNLDLIGIRNAFYPEHYEDASRQINAPFGFGSVLHDEFAAEAEFDGVTLVKRGTRTLIGDAYGTLILPGKDPVDALRIKTVDEIKTLYYYGEFEVANDNLISTTYTWYDQTGKFPLLTVIETLSWNDEDTLTARFAEVYTEDIPTNVKEPELIPMNAELRQNYPNPFNPATEILFSVDRPGNVTLQVYDVLGNKVADLVNGYREAGSHSVNFNASGLSSGTYFYVLNASGTVLSRKMALLK